MPVNRYLLVLGLEVAGIATLATAILGVGLAWLFENRQFAGKRVLTLAATAAMALPAPLLCYWMLAASGRLARPAVPGLAAAGVLSTLPLLLRSARASFAAVNPAYGKAARTLGASEWRVFARVELPQAVRPIAAATALALLRLLLEMAVAFQLADVRA